MALNQEELDQIKLCRQGIIGASSLGALFGVFGGRIALGPAPASFLLKSLVIGASILTGAIVGAGLSVQQSYTFLKSKPTNLAQELKNFSELKRSIYRSNDAKFEDELNDIYNKRVRRLPPTSNKNP